MKTLIASILIFFVMLTGIILNAIFLHRTLGQIQELLDEMESLDASAESVLELETLWADKRNLVALTVGVREVMLMDERLTELKWAQADGTEEEFQKHRALMRAVTEELLRQESLRIDSVF